MNEKLWKFAVEESSKIWKCLETYFTRTFYLDFRSLDWFEGAAIHYFHNQSCLQNSRTNIKVTQIFFLFVVFGANILSRLGKNGSQPHISPWLRCHNRKRTPNGAVHTYTTPNRIGLINSWNCGPQWVLFIRNIALDSKIPFLNCSIWGKMSRLWSFPINHTLIKQNLWH